MTIPLLVVTPRFLRWALLHQALTGMLACPWDENYRHDCCADFDPTIPENVVTLSSEKSRA